MGERRGSLFTFGGYQTPSTNAAAITRGRPVRSLRWEPRAGLVVELALVPLQGGRPELFEVEYRWNDVGSDPKRSMYCPCIVRGDQHAREAFALTAAALDRGELPEAVLTAPGTPLGP
jgi:hypothetical protein